MKLRIFFTSLLTLSPLSLFAKTSLGTISDIATTLADGVVTSIGYLLFTLGVVVFLWGVVQFIWNARQGDSGKGMQNGKQFMVWGLIALFVMFSFWGIITYAQNILGLSGRANITIPRVQLLQMTSSQDSPDTPVCSSPNSVIQLGKTCANPECLEQGVGSSCPLSVGVQGICDASKKCVASERPGAAPQTCQVDTPLGPQAGTLNSSGICIPNPK